MTAEELFARRAVVFGSAIIYWLGVLVQARRVRRRIGRSPNLKPRGAKERLLWSGWLVVILAWMVQPFLIPDGDGPVGLRLSPALLHPAGFISGLAVVAAGYVGTLWCYAAMGDTWRIGINVRERNALVTRGPYRWIRHPIYLFQVVMLAGAALLLPTVTSLLILGVHLLCVFVKATDEEAYLVTVHGKAYRDYLANTGRLLPRLRHKPAADD